MSTPSAVYRDRTTSSETLEIVNSSIIMSVRPSRYGSHVSTPLTNEEYFLPGAFSQHQLHGGRVQHENDDEEFRGRSPPRRTRHTRLSRSQYISRTSRPDSLASDISPARGAGDKKQPLMLTPATVVNDTSLAYSHNHNHDYNYNYNYNYNSNYQSEEGDNFANKDDAGYDASDEQTSSYPSSPSSSFTGVLRNNMYISTTTSTDPPDVYHTDGAPFTRTNARTWAQVASWPADSTPELYDGGAPLTRVHARPNIKYRRVYRVWRCVKRVPAWCMGRKEPP